MDDQQVSDLVNSLVYKHANEIAEELKAAGAPADTPLFAGFSLCLFMAVCAGVEDPDIIMHGLSAVIADQVNAGNWPPVVVKQ